MVAEDEPDEDSPLEEVAVGTVVALTFLVGFGLLAMGNPWFWVAFPVGFAGCIPLAIGLVRLYEARAEREADPDADALETLRERYVRGEIDEEEFEERLALLLETETVSEAEAHAARRDGERETESVGQ